MRKTKSITVCEDENFHSVLHCLVAIEPVSNMIIVEQFAEHRDAVTWNNAVDGGLAGLPVKIIQATSDEAKGLLLHAKTGLGGAHHSPDLFHIQQDLCKATARSLALQTTKAQEVHIEAEKAKLAQKTARTILMIQNEREARTAAKI